LEIKLKGHHFDTIEVIKAELQMMLNTLAEHNLQDKQTKTNSVALSPRANYTD
jgi:hypothetical protein